MRQLVPEDAESGEFDWAGWEALIEAKGITLDRPRGSVHPSYPDIIYPLDYGYVNGTVSSDGDGVDVFVGSAENGPRRLLADHGL